MAMIAYKSTVTAVLVLGFCAWIVALAGKSIQFG